MNLLIMFVEDAVRHSDDDLDTAIASICNALCCRDLRAGYRQELIRLLGKMQKQQRENWKGKP